MNILFQSVFDLDHMSLGVYKNLVGLCFFPCCEIEMMWKKH